jgi:hypothetical protein
MRRVLGIVSALVLLAMAAAPSPSPGGGAPPPQATCVFSNPGFSGKCVENADVGEGSSPTQACQSILQCLNDVDCLKTYCQATTIRSGWKLESAK